MHASIDIEDGAIISVDQNPFIGDAYNVSLVNPNGDGAFIYGTCANMRKYAQTILDNLPPEEGSK